MVDGCLAWQATGLGVPTAVREASADYFHEQDNIAHWLDERTVRRELSFTLTAELFADWEAWAVEHDIEASGTKQAFTQALQARGWTYKKTKHGGSFKGLVLKPKPAGENQNDE
jgi:putative DNA primase/helicase